MTKDDTKPQQSLFGKPSDDTKPQQSLFGKPSDDTKPQQSLFGKPSDDTKPQSLFGESTTSSNPLKTFDSNPDKTKCLFSSSPTKTDDATQLATAAAGALFAKSS
jgi:hypothetical protein